MNFEITYKMILLQGENEATIGCKMLKETEIQDVLYFYVDLGYVNICAYTKNHNVQLNRATKFHVFIKQHSLNLFKGSFVLNKRVHHVKQAVLCKPASGLSTRSQTILLKSHCHSYFFLKWISQPNVDYYKFMEIIRPNESFIQFKMTNSFNSYLLNISFLL